MPRIFKFIMALYLILLSVNSIAQRVTYNDLNYVLYHNVEETEDYLSKKGFSYSGIDKLEENVNIYKFTKNSGSSINYISVDKQEMKNTFCEVSIYTNIQNDYLMFKSNIKKIGFLLKKSYVNNNGSLISDYIKGRQTVSIMIGRNKDYEVTEYYITLTDNELENIAFKNK